MMTRDTGRKAFSYGPHVTVAKGVLLVVKHVD